MLQRTKAASYLAPHFNCLPTHISSIWLTGTLLVILLFGAVGCATVGGGSLGGSGQRTTNASGEAIVRLQHNRPQDIDLSKDRPAPPDKVIPLEVEFAMRNKQEFNELMHRIGDPHSSQYRHWLSSEQMHARFGESQTEFDAVQQWLQAQGFTITDRSYGTNADYIRFKGTIAQIEKAFEVELVLPEFDRYAARNDPAIPARFDGVISRVAGLEEVGPLF